MKDFAFWGIFPIISSTSTDMSLKFRILIATPAKKPKPTERDQKYKSADPITMPEINAAFWMFLAKTRISYNCSTSIYHKLVRNYGSLLFFFINGFWNFFKLFLSSLFTAAAVASKNSSFFNY